MSRLGINTGTSPNDGLGDSLLVGAVKINQNFNELYTKLGDGSDLIPASAGNTYYVTVNGNDTFDGDSLTNSFRTIQKAISVCSSGDTIQVGSGTFYEVFPLTIPSNVTLKGSGIRATKISPTEATKDKDAILLNGDTTVEDLTVGGFYEPGVGFKFADNSRTVLRSPYVQRVTVLNQGSVTSVTDPYGFDTPHSPPSTWKAGRGVLIDGSVVDSSTLEPTMLFNECTFICPNNIALEMTNGGRTEWVNCFTYFADKGIYAHDGGVGLGSTGTIRVKTGTLTGSTPIADDELYYMESDSSSGTYTHIGNYLEITKVGHGLTVGDRVYVNFTSGGSAGGYDGFYQVNQYVGINTFAFAIAANNTSGAATYKKALGFGTVVDYDPVVGLSSILGKGEGRFQLPSERAGKTVTAFGNAALSTVQEKFGTASLLLDGEGDYAKILSNADFGFATDDFTVEAFVRLTGIGTEQHLFDLRESSASDSAIHVSVASTDVVKVSYGSTEIITGITSLTTGSWYHLAVSRSSGSTKLFVSGTQEGDTYSDSNDYGNSKPLVIGAEYNGVNHFEGYIDEVRVSSIARYTSNFTPTTTPFVSDGNDTLILHFDGVTGSTLLVDNSLPIQDIRWVRSGVGIATATQIILADYQQFGASMRSIGSATVFGNTGVTAEGPGSVLRMFAFNFGHIGAGKDFSQDESLVNQGNEIVTSNGGKVYSVSIDQSGDFRVGDAFYVNQQAGTVNFGGQDFSISSLSDLTITDETNTSTITPTSINVGNLQLSSNEVTTTSGDLVFNPSGISSTTVEGDLNVNGTSHLNGSVVLRDNDVIRMGADGDLRIWHDGAQSLISDTGTGSLVIRATDLSLQAANADNFAYFTADGSAALFHDNTKRVETTGYGASITGATFTNNVIERVVGTASSIISVSAGTLTLDLSQGSVRMGDINASVSTWAFTNFPATSEFRGGMLKYTLILDGDVTQTYGDICTVNGVSVTGGIKWQGGSAPAPTNNFDVITFTIVRDSDYNYSVFAKVDGNYS